MEMCIGKKKVEVCNILQEAGMLCEHDSMCGIGLPAAVNTHLTNPALWDLYHRRFGAESGRLLAQVMRNSVAKG